MGIIKYKVNEGHTSKCRRWYNNREKVKRRGILCDIKITLEVKGKFYKNVVRPVMMHESECWTMIRKKKLLLAYDIFDLF